MFFLKCFNCESSKDINKEATIKIGNEGELDLSEVWCDGCIDNDTCQDFDIVIE